MLILSRKAGERVKIDCPDGTVIWLTMCVDGIICDDGGLAKPLMASKIYGSVYFGYSEGIVEIVYMPKRLKQHHDRVGIIAPKSFLILREELIV